jgi:hypothetical protein
VEKQVQNNDDVIAEPVAIDEPITKLPEEA